MAKPIECCVAALASNKIYVLWNEVSVPLPHYTCCDFDLLGSYYVIGHVTIGLAIGSFL